MQSETPETPDAANQPPALDPAVNDPSLEPDAEPPSADAGEADVAGQLAEAQRKIGQLEDAFLRARAEADNIRRRSQLEQTNAHKFAVEGFATELLSVKDSLEAALAADNASVESMRTGVELTLRQLTSVFERFKVAEVNPVGEKFDPHKHQAISMVEAEQPANTVVTVMQKGYLLHERVLRPAFVTVAKANNA